MGSCCSCCTKDDHKVKPERAPLTKAAERVEDIQFQEPTRPNCVPESHVDDLCRRLASLDAGDLAGLRELTAPIDSQFLRSSQLKRLFSALKDISLWPALAAQVCGRVIDPQNLHQIIDEHADIDPDVQRKMQVAMERAGAPMHPLTFRRFLAAIRGETGDRRGTENLDSMNTPRKREKLILKTSERHLFTCDFLCQVLRDGLEHLSERETAVKHMRVVDPQNISQVLELLKVLMNAMTPFQIRFQMLEVITNCVSCWVDKEHLVDINREPSLRTANYGSVDGAPRRSTNRRV